MSDARPTEVKLKSRQLGLAGVIVLQCIAAVFFIGDVVVDLVHAPLAEHSLLEMLVTLALVVGIGLNACQLRRMMERMQAQDRALDTARGDLARIVETQFETWCLTPAERDVGFLALKGLDAAEIAEIRGAAKGTVRAQLTRIYAKAGVSGRAQFAAWFVEDLLDGGLGTAGSHPRSVPKAPIQAERLDQK
ncbi:LuxR family transcriptional regulator [Roseivivax halodurans JCM 10272]|uniref:LuxR family transcriptional regulator n=1 Tax=Roseivivax halodurans JCM 10272 TaxID=1449350 RepID=X7E7F7_9RHOB|nr:helix-turn-helix transcriptional regulator [Roseivivax halodurans]ETX11984.1 LuxR family transcriptional regulator [Roseivivax halodurans JCM 10272]